MKNLESTKVAVEEMEKEYNKYEEARKAAMVNQAVKKAQVREVRDELTNIAVEVYLGTGNHSEKDVLSYAEQIRKLEDGITSAQLAEHRLNVHLVKLENTLKERRDAYERLKALVKGYSEAKKQYAEAYPQAKQIQPGWGNPPLAVRTVERLRPDLLQWASLLGCEDDCATFLKDVEKDA